MATNQSGDSLRGLIQNLVTRSPQEVMGDAATSSLWGSIVTAAVAMIGTIVVATVLIFFIFGPPQQKIPTETKPIAATTVTPPVEATVATVSQTPSETTSEGTSDTEPMDAAEAMGIGETKDPDAKPDTLDNRLDDLLKGLE